MQPSRFRDQNTVEKSRLANFIGLDNMTSQLPLIEVLPRVTRIWVAYDLARICGTYLEVRRNGLVVCVTQYEHNRKEHIVRPANEPRKPARLHPKPKPSAKNRRPKQAKKVHGRKKHARAKKQGRNGRVAA